MSLAINITIKGDKEVERKLQTIGRIDKKLHAAFVVIGKEAVQYYETQGFTDQGRPWGNPWAPLSQVYKIAKEKKFPGRPTLVATGDMQGSFRANAEDDSVEIDNTSEYYKYHQSRASRKGNLPRRQMAGINNPIKRIVRDAIHDEIVRQIARV